MNKYNLIARSRFHLYFEHNLNLIAVQLMSSEEFIRDKFFYVQYVADEEEAQLLLDMKNESELNSAENQSVE